jgi:hypothetical protein
MYHSHQVCIFMLDYWLNPPLNPFVVNDCLFMYLLFNDAAWNSDYIAFNDGMING